MSAEDGKSLAHNKDMPTQPSFRVVIFSGADPAHIDRLVSRILTEVPEAQVCGILCERRPAKTMSKRAGNFLRNLKQRDFIEYAASKVVRSLSNKAASAGTRVLQFVHGGPPELPPVMDPVQHLESVGCSFRVTTDYHCEESLQFIRSLNADL